MTSVLSLAPRRTALASHVLVVVPRACRRCPDSMSSHSLSRR
ncbi:hypothetical protein [Cellulomonas sp. URHD0024]|nr:hypothetical protein [Cellulomonas sp. URHD0024]